MQRRQAVRQMLLISGGIIFLGSCKEDAPKASVTLDKLKIDGNDEKLLGDLAETILPKTNTPGALDLGAHLFVLTMVNDCYKKEDQDRFVKGMKAFTEKADKDLKTNFGEATAEQRAAWLKEVDASKDKEDLNYFYSTVKRHTIQAYTSSQFYLTKIDEYKLIPGPYKGCVPVQNNIRKTDI